MSVDYGCSVVISAPFEATIVKRILRNFLNQNAYYYDISGDRKLEFFDENQAFHALRGYSPDSRIISVILNNTAFSLCFKKMPGEKTDVSLGNFSGVFDGDAWRKDSFGVSYYDLARYSRLLLSTVREFEIDSFETGQTDWENHYPYFDNIDAVQAFIEACPMDGLIMDLKDQQAEIEDIVQAGMQNENVFFDAHFNRLIDANAIAQQAINVLSRGDEVFYNIAIQNHITQIGFKFGPHDQLVVGIIPLCTTAHTSAEKPLCNTIFFLENAFALIEDFGICTVIGKNLNRCALKADERDFTSEDSQPYGRIINVS